MARIWTSRTTQRQDGVWQDPDPSKNRIFLDHYAYNFNTLAPTPTENWWWTTRDAGNAHNLANSADNTGALPVMLTQGPCLTGSAFSNAEATAYFHFAGYDIWNMSLDVWNYPASRGWFSPNTKRVLFNTLTMSSGGNVGAYWWSGIDIAWSAFASYTGNDASTNNHIHCWEQTEYYNESGTWSYTNPGANQNTVVTVNLTAHGLSSGTFVTVTNAQVTGSGAPNGKWSVWDQPSANSFTYIGGPVPTGTAVGNLNFTATEYRSWGVRTRAELSSVSNGSNPQHMSAYFNLNGFSSVGGISVPQPKVLNTVGHSFFMGTDTQYVYYLRMQADGTTANYRYDILRYSHAKGAGVETTMIGNIGPGSPLTNTAPWLPSNLRRHTANRYVIFSSHMGSDNTYQPSRIVWDQANGTFTTSTCSLSLPLNYSTTTFYSATGFFQAPVSTGHNAYGMNSWWSKPHQWVQDGFVYITMTNQQKFTTTARYNTQRRRQWITFRTTEDTNDNIWTFHSGFYFTNYPSDFPQGWCPMTQAGNKIATFSSNGVIIHTFNTSTQQFASYAVDTSPTSPIVTLNFAADHGLSAGANITVTGTTATSQPINGCWKVIDAPTLTSLRFQADFVPTTPTLGTGTITLGWQPGLTTAVRARSYGVDSLGRLWVTVRNTTIGESEIHLIRDDVPSKVTLALSTPVSGTNNKYLYSGSTIATTLLVSAYDSQGQRLASTITLTIIGNSMNFSNNLKFITVVTSTVGETNVGVNIIGSGATNITVTTAI